MTVVSTQQLVGGDESTSEFFVVDIVILWFKIYYPIPDFVSKLRIVLAWNITHIQKYEDNSVYKKNSSTRFKIEYV